MYLDVYVIQAGTARNVAPKIGEMRGMDDGRRQKDAAEAKDGRYLGSAENSFGRRNKGIPIRDVPIDLLNITEETFEILADACMFC